MLYEWCFTCLGAVLFFIFSEVPPTPPHAPQPFVILAEFEIQEAEHSQLHLDTVF